MLRPLEVLVLEDHQVVRKGLELILRQAGFRVAGVASHSVEARDLLSRRRHDLVLLDIRLGDGDCLGLISDYLAERRGGAVVIYTGLIEPEMLSAAATSGARGFVLKSSPPETLLGALRTVAGGGTSVDPELARMLTPSSPDSKPKQLSRRERQILDLLAAGHTGEEVAQALVISPETVRTHIRNAMEKLQARTRTHAVALALRDPGAA